MCLEWFPAHSAMLEISMYKCSITLSRDTNDSRRSVLVRIGMRRAYATKTTTFLMCCNGCSLAIGDRNTIRTAVVFRLDLLASALSCVAVSGRWEGKGKRWYRLVSTVHIPLWIVRVHTCTFAPAPRKAGCAHLRETRRYRRDQSSLTSRVCRIWRMRIWVADVY